MSTAENYDIVNVGVHDYNTVVFQTVNKCIDIKNHKTQLNLTAVK